MRDNRYFALCDHPAEPPISLQELDQKVKDFLARGGKVQQIPTGVSTFEPLSVLRKNKGLAQMPGVETEE